jgi:hypothetical protein
LCQQRLQAEIAQLKVPVQRIYSLIIDDMSIKEKMHYSRSEDHIFGFDNCQSKIMNKNPKTANKMLCFVIYGLLDNNDGLAHICVKCNFVKNGVKCIYEYTNVSSVSLLCTSVVCITHQ